MSERLLFHMSKLEIVMCASEGEGVDWFDLHSVRSLLCIPSGCRGHCVCLGQVYGQAR